MEDPWLVELWLEELWLVDLWLVVESSSELVIFLPLRLLDLPMSLWVWMELELELESKLELELELELVGKMTMMMPELVEVAQFHAVERIAGCLWEWDD